MSRVEASLQIQQYTKAWELLHAIVDVYVMHAVAEDERDERDANTKEAVEKVLVELESMCQETVKALVGSRKHTASELRKLFTTVSNWRALLVSKTYGPLFSDALRLLKRELQRCMGGCRQNTASVLHRSKRSKHQS
uniref:Betaine aldehyde dehydrogenase n=1 Tax=Lygus hesperus TaxID=30085 RepID=A0A0A9Y0C2_LYGHE